MELLTELRTGTSALPRSAVLHPDPNAIAARIPEPMSAGWNPKARMSSRSSGVVSVMVSRVRYFVVALAFLLVASTARAELSRARAKIAAAPKRGETPAAFVPPGWSVEVELEADLDGDHELDTVLVALEPDPEYDRERAVLILLRRDTEYVLGGSNVGLVACFQCAGVKGGDGTPTIAVEKRVLLVDQIAGSRQFTMRRSRFRWNPKRSLFEWIGGDVQSADAITGASTETSCNFLTRTCIETESPEQVDEEGNEVDRPSVTRTWKLSKRRLRTLEQVQE